MKVEKLSVFSPTPTPLRIPSVICPSSKFNAHRCKGDKVGFAPSKRISLPIYDDSLCGQQKNPRPDPTASGARHSEAAGGGPSSPTMSDTQADQREGSRPAPIPIREALGEVASPSNGRSAALAASPEVAPRIGIARGVRRRPKKLHHGARSTRAGSGRSPRRAESVKRQSLAPTPIESLPSRKFDGDGCEWIVRLSGRASVGSRGDTGAQLLHLTFFRAEDPSVAARQAVAVGKTIEDFPEDRLRELLGSARAAD